MQTGDLDGPQQEIGDYVIGRLLGSGTTGKVRLGINKATGENVAVKIIRKSQFSTRPDLQNKIRREVALMRLLNHPHLMKLHEVCESGRHLYIVLELCSHGELFDYLVARRHLEPAEALMFFRELIYGLDYLHAHAICHRDLKPENILLDSFGHVKIADFGFARWMRSNIADTSCGSPHYAAPEVVRGHRYDGRAADIWSCGVILYALLAGRLPFDDPSIRTLLAKVKAGKYAMPDFPDPIQDLISRMLCSEADRRITVEQVKCHPAFRMYLPDGYFTPRPLPIQSLCDPVEVPQEDSMIMNVLRGIGYTTDEEIVAELTSAEHTNAKVFYEMYRRSVSVESLPWDTEMEHYQTSDDAFTMSPRMINPMDGQYEVFGMRKVDHDTPGSIGSAKSLAQKSSWGIDAVGIEQMGTESTFGDIQVRVEVLMEAMQRMLTENQYKWFHQDDMSIIAKMPDAELYVAFRARYETKETLSMTVELMVGSEQDFHTLVAEVQTEILSVSPGE